MLIIIIIWKIVKILIIIIKSDNQKIKCKTASVQISPCGYVFEREESWC